MLDRLERALRSGGGYAELRLHDNDYTQLTLRKGSLLDNSTSRIGGVSARCHAAGGFGFACLPARSDVALRDALATARSNAGLLAARCPRAAGALPQTEPGTGVFDYGSRDSVFGAAERLDVVRSLDAYIARRYPGLLSRDLALSTISMEKALATSVGALTYSRVPRSTLLVKFAMQANDGVVELHDTFGGFGEAPEQFSRLDDLYAHIDKLYDELREKAAGAYCTAGEYDVVLDAAVTGMLAHEAIGHTCEADAVLGGSIAADLLGKPVASPKITLVDFAGRGPDGGASLAIHVDDEGTPCRDVTIIGDGVLRGYLTDKESAARLGMEPTGNARAFEFKDEPLVRMRNTAILPGTDRLADMIAAVERGYYFKRSLNGQADATSEFTFGIACGYEIVEGRLGRPIRDTTISGVAFDVLESVTHVGDELQWMKGGWCGKKQLIPVGMGGPAIKCRLTVGGM